MRKSTADHARPIEKSERASVEPSLCCVRHSQVHHEEMESCDPTLTCTAACAIGIVVGRASEESAFVFQIAFVESSRRHCFPARGSK